MICDLPNKMVSSFTTNLILYFMTNLRREPANFFIFYLFSFMCVLCMSMVFRTIASLSRTLSQAMAPAAVIILALVIYTGFAIPTRNMHPWFRWLNWLDPVAYAFEALMVNEACLQLRRLRLLLMPASFTTAKSLVVHLFQTILPPMHLDKSVPLEDLKLERASSTAILTYTLPSSTPTVTYGGKHCHDIA